MATEEKSNKQVAILGGGCFWCTEAVFLRVRGVTSVTSGYTGGTVPNPTYEQICRGDTGHAEVIRIEFSPDVISFEQVLDIFFHTHDPTTLNRQGADSGTQYRSAVFFNSSQQKAVAADIIKTLDDSGVFRDPIVTTLEELKKFYPAEDYHQNYYNLNPNQGYCRVVIDPKMAKFRKRYSKLLKPAETEPNKPQAPQ
ncbi:MAG: peptide-methionine (S)-S-oxide reductase MsrA [Fuerstiella sp.]|nr:peptide-methionine (S)-S-oxide reductase MsrA [Fuerstiella sp.]